MAIPSVIGDDTAKADKIQGPGATTVTFGGKPLTLIGDKTVNGETVTGPGSTTVTFGGKFVALVGDNTTASVKKNKREYWGVGPISGPGATTVTIGK